ncbi:cation transporter [Vibrio ulleungensis]|uniref:Cation transporter n=1 Tax=Vibrio ulleungensis TaxID=2807619 RepID=A0ABS2HN35_9VIBR|nr:cation transporter [Vibrio ulleungensis]MBM7038486.1 cation transporter [Vibrio ulleungensis]
MEDAVAKIERNSISVGIVANIVMALSGWFAFYLTRSEALLLDGNMSFILFLTSIIALKISSIKARRTDTFPFGLYVTEALYSMMKGLLLLGVVISAVTSNGSKIIRYLEGDSLTMIKTGPIVYYAIAMVSICWGLSAFYYFQNRKAQFGSSMLKVDQKASLIDGVLSASTGVILVLIGYVSVGSKWDFLLYIGDALLVVVLALCMLGQPISIIKQSFVELAGGRLQDKPLYTKIESAVRGQMAAAKLEYTLLNVSKTGSSYLVLLSLPIDIIRQKPEALIVQAKQNMHSELTKVLNNVDVEWIIEAKQ